MLVSSDVNIVTVSIFESEWRESLGTNNGGFDVVGAIGICTVKYNFFFNPKIDFQLFFFHSGLLLLFSIVNTFE